MSKTSSKQAVFSATSAAEKALDSVLSKNGNTCAGIRVSVRNRGCTGRSYVMTFVTKVDPLDQACSVGKHTIFIDPKALMFLIGTTLDYEKKDTSEGFVFKNPNEKGRCGCGDSFYT